MAFILSLMLISTTSVFAFETQDDIVVTAYRNYYDSFVNAVIVAGLEETLSSEGPFTVFVPSEEAFSKLLTDLNISSAQLLAHPRLKEVLLYHVVSEEVLESDFDELLYSSDTLDFEFETALGFDEKLTFTKDLKYKINGNVNIIETDILASNGVIHVIDAVLIPEAFFAQFDTVLDFLESNDEFSIFLSALQVVDFGLLNALEGDKFFTWFVPNNEAILKLLDELDLTVEEFLAQTDLRKILLYHVHFGRLASKNITDGSSVPSLMLGYSLSFSVNNNPSGGLAGLSIFINDDIEIISADFLARNGIIHVIGDVLVPSNFLLDDPIPDTRDDNSLIWIGLLLVVGVGLVITTRSLGKKSKLNSY